MSFWHVSLIKGLRCARDGTGPFRLLELLSRCCSLEAGWGKGHLQTSGCLSDLVITQGAQLSLHWLCFSLVCT